MKRCVALVEYEDGEAAWGEYSLKHNLPFSLLEMEQWIKDQSDRPVKSVKCSKMTVRDKAIAKALMRTSTRIARMKGEP